ncbi:hypothetical protein BDF20DRAFT_837809 [Mycotypha africana]|uniref:uncharacterized protein n=1 Tax=Mycotypha africana TaxID=64632 RepID=UPI002301312D|nr:uncharacterized protein BDF20DRAFT_837809 [Mycotypha africana]KAI8971484.1 hypothetical protein BDF20DRAFT_837809 [Mycotypha africana]
MPGPATIFSIGAVGAGAAAMYVNRRNSQSSGGDESVFGGNSPPAYNTPHALARRRSSTVRPDHYWNERKQPEYMWRRDNGISFSHNSKPKFPIGLTQKDIQQTSSTK